MAPHFGIRTTLYKLIRFYGPHNSWELFDLKKDVMEMHNVYGNPQYKETIVQLKKQLANLISQYKDEDAAKIMGHD